MTPEDAGDTHPEVAAVDQILLHRLVAVVTAPVEEALFDWAIAVAEGGISYLAIPVTMPNVTEVTADLADEAALHVGVFGVVSVDQVSVALAAGADFIVVPICDPEIILAAKERGLTVIAGAATPTEVAMCARAEPDLVTIFPAGYLGGPPYLRALVQRFPALPLSASGGIDVENAPSFLEAGAQAIFVDRGVFPRSEDPAALEVITARASALTEVCTQAVRDTVRPPPA